MTRRRALLTDRERELIADEDAESQRYVAISRVRTKIEDELPGDLRILKKHHPDLLEELREVVCEDVETHTPPPTGPNTTPETASERSEPVDTTEEPQPAGGEQADADSVDALDEALREFLEANDYSPKTPHGRDLVTDVFRLLRQDGPMKTGDLQDELYPNYDEHWSSGRTMWNAIDRYLEEIPGIEKAGYGEWGYSGDDAVREELADDTGEVTWRGDGR